MERQQLICRLAMWLFPDQFIFRLLYVRRRRRSLGLMKTVGTHEPAVTDTAEASYSSKDIARELSDVVLYTETIRFNGFKVVT